MASNLNQKNDRSEEPLLTTIEAARDLGLAVRSVQMMVDRGELEAWKTPGGHRRIFAASVQRWMRNRGPQPGAQDAGGALARLTGEPGQTGAGKEQGRAPRVLLVEDSQHFQNLMRLLMEQHFPGTEFHVSADGISGLVLYGKLQPDVLVIDILLPGIDGDILVTSLRSQPGFDPRRLIVVTSLDEQARAPRAFALQGLSVIHKSRLALDLPPLMEQALALVSRSAT